MSMTTCRILPFYGVVQLNFTTEIEVFYMLFEISLPIFSMKSLKQHMYYMHFHFRCKIQLDLTVLNVGQFSQWMVHLIN